MPHTLLFFIVKPLFFKELKIISDFLLYSKDKQSFSNYKIFLRFFCCCFCFSIAKKFSTFFLFNLFNKQKRVHFLSFLSSSTLKGVVMILASRTASIFDMLLMVRLCVPDNILLISASLLPNKFAKSF
jgi:hypothetical protein